MQHSNSTTEQFSHRASRVLYPNVPAVQLDRSQALQQWVGLSALTDVCNALTQCRPAGQALSGILINPGQIEQLDSTERGAVLVVNLPEQYAHVLPQLVVESPNILFCYGINSKRGHDAVIWGTDVENVRWEVRVSQPVFEKLVAMNRGGRDAECAAVWVPVIFTAGNVLCSGGFWAGEDWKESGMYTGTYIVDEREYADRPLLPHLEGELAFPWYRNFWTSEDGRIRAMHVRVMDCHRVPDAMPTPQQASIEPPVSGDWPAAVEDDGMPVM